jgi:predicted metal-dependent phosphoesterase TrpH
MLGYGVDIARAPSEGADRAAHGGRDDRNPRIVRKLNELTSRSPWRGRAGRPAATSLGRPHIAAVLLRKGYVSSIKQAFDKYLGQGGAAYFDTRPADARAGMELIRQAGGAARAGPPGAAPHRERRPARAYVRTGRPRAGGLE